jgi:hypothetical protein
MADLVPDTQKALRRLHQAFAVRADGARVPLEAESIEIALASGGRLVLDLGTLCGTDTVSLLTGVVVSGQEDDFSRLVVYPGAPNAVHVAVTTGPAGPACSCARQADSE